MSSTHKQVRQVLANELGLDRETVDRILRERIDKLLSEPAIVGVINDQVRRTLDQMMKSGRHDYHSLRSIAHEAIERDITRRLNVSVSLGPRGQT